MIRRNLDKNWPLKLGFSALILAGLIAVSAEFGGGLSHLQTGGQSIAVFYWASLFYETAAIPLTGVLLLITVTLVIVSIVQSAQGQTRRAMGGVFAVFLAMIAIVLAVFSVLPNLLVGYTHLDSTEFNGRRYNLGVKISFDGDFSYIVGACDRLGIRCNCCAVSSAASYGWQDAKFARSTEMNTLLIKGSDGTIDLQELDCMNDS
jgi:hypothetical protein